MRRLTAYDFFPEKQKFVICYNIIHHLFSIYNKKAAERQGAAFCIIRFLGVSDPFTE